MIVFTPQTVTAAPVITNSVAYPNAFAPCSATLKSSSAFGGAAFFADAGGGGSLEDDGTAGGLGSVAVPAPTLDVRRGGGGASCMYFERMTVR